LKNTLILTIFFAILSGCSKEKCHCVKSHTLYMPEYDAGWGMIVSKEKEFCDSSVCDSNIHIITK
jgi:hypothetical protein